MKDEEIIQEVNQEKLEKQQQLEKDFANHFMEEITRRILIAEKAHEMDKKIIMVDIDGTICSQTGEPGSVEDAYGFKNAEPFTKRIEYLNNLHDEGHFIHYYTARGALTGIDHLKETKEQLDSWGVKYNDLAVFKPFYDVWIDDKAVGVRRDSEGSISEFKNNIEEAIRTS